MTGVQRVVVHPVAAAKHRLRPERIREAQPRHEPVRGVGQCVLSVGSEEIRPAADEKCRSRPLRQRVRCICGLCGFGNRDGERGIKVAESPVEPLPYRSLVLHSKAKVQRQAAGCSVAVLEEEAVTRRCGVVRIVGVDRHGGGDAKHEKLPSRDRGRLHPLSRRLRASDRC
jgi:hypothetical protein